MGEEEILEYSKNLSYENKIKLISKIVPLEDFNNQKYRENILREHFNIPETKGYYGPDFDNGSFKTVTISPTKKNTYNITKGKTLGIMGRIDKEETHDNLNTIFGIFNKNGNLKFAILVRADENLNQLFEIEKKLKQKKMRNGKNKYDGKTINFNVIFEYGLSYQILFKDDDVHINLD